MSHALSVARVVEPEWLDLLPRDDPRAVRSRRDLALLNRVMMHVGIMSRRLGRLGGGGPLKLLEIGSGDGRLMLAVARRLARRMEDVHVLLLDRQNCVASETLQAFAGLGWRVECVQADVFDFLRASTDRFGAITANLFLHHFEPAPLAELFGLAARRTPFFAACEPRRDAFALAGSHMVGVLGCNDVTRHDAVASVRAGFAARDLTELWPRAAGWRFEERRAGPFTHAFVAREHAESWA